MTPRGIIVHHSLTQDGIEDKIGYCINDDHYIDIHAIGHDVEKMEMLVDLTVNLIVMYGITIDDINPASANGYFDIGLPWDAYINRVKEVMS